MLVDRCFIALLGPAANAFDKVTWKFYFITEGPTQDNLIVL